MSKASGPFYFISNRFVASMARDPGLVRIYCYLFTWGCAHFTPLAHYFTIGRGRPLRLDNA